VVIPPYLRGSEGGHCTLQVSCTMVRTNNRKRSEGTGRESGGLDKHLGPIFFDD